MITASIIIPTRRRPDTLKHTLAMVLEIPDRDVEIIVLDNGAIDETRAVINSFDDNRLVYAPTDIVLPMSQNWERGLDLASGEYITYIGDDDGLLPWSVDVLKKVRKVHDAKIIRGSFVHFFWPDSPTTNLQSHLMIFYYKKNLILNNKNTLKSYMSGFPQIFQLSSVYNSFVHRSIIYPVREKLGSYFITQSPDIASGVVNLFHADETLRLQCPLHVGGQSSHSTGASLMTESRNSEPINTFFKENPRVIHESLRTKTISTINIPEGYTGSERLFLAEKLYQNLGELAFHPQSVLNEVFAKANNESALYEPRKMYAHELAERFHLTLPDWPDKTLLPEKSPPQVSDMPGDDAIRLSIDTASLGVAHPGQTTPLVRALFPIP